MKKPTGPTGTAIREACADGSSMCGECGANERKDDWDVNTFAEFVRTVLQSSVRPECLAKELNKDGSMKKPTGPTGTAIREAARLQRRVDELQETLEIVAAKSERHRLECEFWRDEFLKRIKEEANAKTV